MVTDSLTSAPRIAFSEDVNTVLRGCRSDVRAAIIDYVSQIDRFFADEVISITLYGSQARGDARPASDIDLFVVVPTDDRAVHEALHDLAWRIQYQHDVIISDIVRTQQQSSQMQAQQFPYYRSIMREGLVLWKSVSVPTPHFA